MLARSLGRTIGELRATMTEPEYLRWCVFHEYERHLQDHARAVAEAQAGA